MEIKEEGNTEGGKNPILKLSWEMDSYIENKYKTPQDQKDARLDAITYAAAQLAWEHLNPYLHPDDSEEEIEFSQDQKRRAEEALNGVKVDDWQPMKEYIQSLARLSFGTSVGLERLRERTHYTQSGDEDQQRGEAFINLAKSLRT